MTDRERETLRDRAAALGVASSYVDALGERRPVALETIRAILAVMDVDVATDAAAIAAIDARLAAPWRRGLAPVTVATVTASSGSAEADVTIPVATRDAALDHARAWTLVAEDGDVVARGAFLPDTNVSPLEIATVDGETYRRDPLSLGRLTVGYYRLTLGEATATIVVAPERCWLPPEIVRGERLWGVAVQLYGLHSAHSLGVGDLRDLATFAELVGAAGGDVVGVNPLHDVDVVRRTPSPYSPSSRFDVAALYLDVGALPGHDPADLDPPAVEPLVDETEPREPDARLVDYAAAAAAKRRAIHAAYARFRTDAAADDLAAFRRFVEAGGVALRRGAIFHALAERFGSDATGVPWRAWPRAYHDPDSAEVVRFAEIQAEAVDRALYVQWQADVQLGVAAEAARRAGCAVGLYRDVAVGAATGGAETWVAGRAMSTGVTVGAPPDIVNRDGQNWGVAPFDPLALRETGYAAFVRLLRANMRHAGAIRIDHVMALARLWWVPEGLSAADGGYVRYPLDELLAVVALESVRARCLVVGEDLGTVPDGFRDELARRAILSYRLLTFEVAPDGTPVPPARYPALALVASGTHDLAPIAAHVAGHDLAVRAGLGLLRDDADLARERDLRRAATALLFAAFAREGITPPALPALPDPRGGVALGAEERDAIVDAATRYLARSPSALLLVPLEDVLGELHQPNVPTTIDEHPNWRRRAALSLEEMRDGRVLDRIRDLARDAGRGRDTATRTEARADLRP